MNKPSKSKKTVNILKVIFQVLLFFILGWAGMMKFFNSDDLPFPWIKDHPQLVLITGVFDILGSIGIVLSPIFGLKSKITVLSSIGIIFLMLSAIVFHILRHETGDITFNLLMMAMAGFIIWAETKYLKSQQIV